MEQEKTFEQILEENQWRYISGEVELSILSDMVQAHVLGAWVFHPRMERDRRPKQLVKTAIEVDITKMVIETQSGDQDYLCVINKEIE